MDNEGSNLRSGVETSLIVSRDYDEAVVTSLSRGSDTTFVTLVSRESDLNIVKSVSRESDICVLTSVLVNPATSQLYFNPRIVDRLDLIGIDPVQFYSTVRMGRVTGKSFGTNLRTWKLPGVHASGDIDLPSTGPHPLMTCLLEKTTLVIPQVRDTTRHRD